MTMNVFKLLSRTANGAQTSHARNLPSSGAASSPQLFGQSTTSAQQERLGNRKRKRGQDNAQVTAALPAELDFFGTKSGINGSVPSVELQHDANCEDVQMNEEDHNPDAEDFELGDEECARILQSHKLKITVLKNSKSPIVQDIPQTKAMERRKKKIPDKTDDLRILGEGGSAKAHIIVQPLQALRQLRTRYGVSRRLVQNLIGQGYKLPTEVQLGAMPLLLGQRSSSRDSVADNARNTFQHLEGRDIDLLAVAPTGSGKTVAFLVPIIDKILSEQHKGTITGPYAVIVAPTRELASQIVNETRKLVVGVNVKVALMKKGMEIVDRLDNNNQSAADLGAEESDGYANEDDVSNDSTYVVNSEPLRPQKAEKVKATILVATPLAIVNALKQHDGTLATMPTVCSLVLDEADVLLDRLFREQTLSIWRACTNSQLRVGLWSATMGSNIESLAMDTIDMRWKSLPNVSTDDRRGPFVRLVVGLKDTAVPNIRHQLIYAATEQGKLLGLRQLLHPNTDGTDVDAHILRPPFLVFTQTIPRAVALHSELLYDIPPEAGGSSRIAVLHADLSSTARESIMTRFRRGEIWIMITTDLLARGVDFRGLNGVVNYDVPNSAAAYVHRVGRTGRAGRSGGVAVTFYTQEDIPYVRVIANVVRASEKLKGKSEDDASVKQWLLDALPTPTKREKQDLKKKGVKSRRCEDGGERKGKMRISTKSGFERRIENRRKGAKVANQRTGGPVKESLGSGDSSEFEGFD